MVKIGFEDLKYVNVEYLENEYKKFIHQLKKLNYVTLQFFRICMCVFMSLCLMLNKEICV